VRRRPVPRFTASVFFLPALAESDGPTAVRETDGKWESSALFRFQVKNEALNNATSTPPMGCIQSTSYFVLILLVKTSSSLVSSRHAAASSLHVFYSARHEPAGRRPQVGAAVHAQMLAAHAATLRSSAPATLARPHACSFSACLAFFTTNVPACTCSQKKYKTTTLFLV